MRSGRIAWAAPAIWLLLLTGCSATAGAQGSAGQAAAAFHAAFAAKNWSAACALLAPGTSDELTEHGQSTCAAALAGQDLPATGAVQQVQVWGLAAQVIMNGDVVFLTTTD